MNIARAFTHTNGEISGTKMLLVLFSVVICIRILAPLVDPTAKEISLSEAAYLMLAVGGIYGWRQQTEKTGKNFKQVTESWQGQPSQQRGPNDYTG